MRNALPQHEVCPRPSPERLVGMSPHAGGRPALPLPPRLSLPQPHSQPERAAPSLHSLSRGEQSAEPPKIRGNHNLWILSVSHLASSRGVKSKRSSPKPRSSGGGSEREALTAETGEVRPKATWARGQAARLRATAVTPVPTFTGTLCTCTSLPPVAPSGAKRNTHTQEHCDAFVCTSAFLATSLPCTWQCHRGVTNQAEDGEG